MDTESGSTPSSDTSPRPSDDSENDSPITPPSFTHNHVLADCHIKDFNHVLDALRSGAERLSTSDQSGHKYTSLHALLLSWEGDDLGVGEEVSNLGSVLRDQYAFDVHFWRIPIEQPIMELTMRIGGWTKEHQGADKLLLMYYAGHGWMDSSRQAVWSNRRQRDEKYAELKWSGCEEILHESVSDTLFLLDCCHAGSSVSQARKGFSETIAASGFENRAPLPGPHSFTNALTRILSEWSRKSEPFTIAALHVEILTYLKIIPPDQLSRDGLTLATASNSMEMETFEWRRTPVHYIRSTYQYVSSIVLAPRTRDMKKPFIDLNVPPVPKPDNSPRVVLSISLTEDVRAGDAESCRRWLKSFPLPTQGVVVEGVFKSFSTVVLVSVELEVWDVLPDIPGCNFVCYSQSSNLLAIEPMSNSTQWGVKLAEPDSEWRDISHPAIMRSLARYSHVYARYRESDEEYEPMFRVYSYVFKKFLPSTLEEDRADRAHPTTLRYRAEIQSLDASEFEMLSTDVLGELIRREGQDQSGSGVAPFLHPENNRHLLRARARRELMDVGPHVIGELAREILLELDRRLLSLKWGNTPWASQSSKAV